MPCLHKKFSEVSAGDLAGCEKVILSGRRRNSSEINAANSKIVKQCYKEGKPVLGICYGAEIIALTLGGSIKRMPAHISGMTSVSVSKPTKLAPGKGLLSVYESHAFCVARLPPGFQSLANSQYCEHEIFADEGKRIYGTQFHPEKSKQDGMTVLKNFATYV